MSQQLAVINSPEQQFSLCTADAFSHVQRVAACLASSNMVPDTYKGNVPNTVIALDLSQKMGIHALTCMQNLHIIHGRPSWSSQFITGKINSCGRFSALRYHKTGDIGSDERTYTAWAYDMAAMLASEEIRVKCLSCASLTKAQDDGLPILEGAPVSMAMAKAEGWFGKSGSKWKTMPELMLSYRAATFFGRMYAPDLLMGLTTVEEAEDIGGTASYSDGPVTGTAVPTTAGDTAAASAGAAVAGQRRRSNKGAAAAKAAEVVVEAETGTNATVTEQATDAAHGAGQEQKAEAQPESKPEPKKEEAPKAEEKPAPKKEESKPEPKKEETKKVAEQPKQEPAKTEEPKKEDPKQTAAAADNDLEQFTAEIIEVTERKTTNGVAYLIETSPNKSNMYWRGDKKDIPGVGSMVDMGLKAMVNPKTQQTIYIVKTFKTL